MVEPSADQAADVEMQPENPDEKADDQIVEQEDDPMLGELAQVDAPFGLDPGIEALEPEVKDYLQAGLGIDEIIQQYVDDDRVANIDGGPDMLAGRGGLIWRLKPELFDEDRVAQIEANAYDGLDAEIMQEDGPIYSADDIDEEMEMLPNDHDFAEADK